MHPKLTQPLDRGHDLRGNTAWLETQLNDPNSEFIPVWQLQNLMTDDRSRPARLSLQDIANLIPDAESIILLGVSAGHACFAIGLGSTGEGPAASQSPLQGYGQWSNLRAVADQLERLAQTFLEGGVQFFIHGFAYLFQFLGIVILQGL